MSPLGSAQAFDGANPPGCHYDNGKTCKGGYHINMKGTADSVNDAAYLYKIPDGHDKPEDGTIIWSAPREHHTQGATTTAEFWTFPKEEGYHYQVLLDVSIGGWSHKFELDAETDYCYRTVHTGNDGDKPTYELWWDDSNSGNPGKRHGDCNLK
jgi:hypothetical protein